MQCIYPLVEMLRDACNMVNKMDIFIIWLSSVIMLAECIPCDNGDECPDYLPYCTPAGCVFRCPERVFVNGSNCVQECGKGYIFNSTCVDSCPANHPLIEEQINYKFEKLKFCRSRCDTNTFAYNGTCIRNCPTGNKYVENGACSSNCSASKPLHRNITSNNQLVGIECLAACDKTSKYPFEYIKECESKCSDSQVVFDGKCMQDCPTHSQILINLQMCQQLWTCQDDWPEQKYCSDKCPLTPFFSYVYNNSCVNMCPETAKLSLNGRCVNRCPDQQYIWYKYRNLNRLVESIECCKECPYPLRSNNYTMECLDTCPVGLNNFNRTCLIECPNDTNIEIDKETDELSCVPHCKKYILNNLCIDTCPDDAKYVNGSHCVTECPKSNPYRTKNQIRCLKECPEYLVKNSLSNECVARCPENMFNYHKTCVSDCPVNTFKATKGMKCVEVCEEFELSGTCVDSCRRYSANGSCVDTCSGSYKVAYHGLCHHACPENTCVSEDGFNCTDTCMRDLKHNKLVYKCPESAPYTRKCTSEKQCVPACDKYEALNDFTCINVTECDRAVLSNGLCANDCPDGYLYMPDSESKLVSSVNGYEYSIEDADDNPCKTVTNVYLNLVVIGFFLLLIIALFIVFLSTVPFDIPTCKREKKKDARNEEVRRGGRTNENFISDQHAITVPTDEQQDDVPLLTEVADNIPSRESGDVPLLTEVADNIPYRESGDVPWLTEVADNIPSREIGDVPWLTEVADNIKSEESRDVPLFTGIADNVPSEESRDMPSFTVISDNIQSKKVRNVTSFNETSNVLNNDRYLDEYELPPVVAAHSHNDLDEDIRDDVSVLSTNV